MMGCCLAGCEKGASGSDDAKGNALTVKPADAGTLTRFETFSFYLYGFEFHLSVFSLT